MEINITVIFLFFVAKCLSLIAFTIAAGIIISIVHFAFFVKEKGSEFFK